MNTIINYFVKGIVIIVILGLAYYAWVLQRNLNYHFGYQDDVQKEISISNDTYNKRIKSLENRVLVLEQKLQETQETQETQKGSK